MKKKVLKLTLLLFLLLNIGFTSVAASYSSAWYLNGGNWYIKGPNGYPLAASWVCDNAAGPGSQDNWYLIDTNCTMVTKPLVVDANGFYYSLETSHNGNYGMLRYINGIYDGVNLVFNQVHNGAFGAIVNPDGINALIAKYGAPYNISHIKNVVYTANYTYTTAPVTYSTTTYTNNNNTVTRRVNYYVGNSKYKTTSTTGTSARVIDYGSTLKYWRDGSDGSYYYPGDTIYFDGRTTVNLYGEFYSSQWAEDPPSVQKTYTIYYYIDGEYYTSDTSTSSTMYVNDYGNGLLEKYTVGIGGDAIYPGQYYTFTGGQTSVSLYGILSSQDPDAEQFSDD